jgi:hypothetical protein
MIELACLIAWVLVLLFTLALCRAAGNADRRDDE